MQNIHIYTNQDDSSSDHDDYYNNNVACIVFGNNEFKRNCEDEAKKNNQTVDQFIGQGFSFGKYLDFEADEKKWQAQLDDLQEQLSDNNHKFANLKGIKFILDEHGKNGKVERYLAGSYKSKRFQKVAEIINDYFLSKNEKNKLYFNNRACYGAYFFDEFKRNTDIPRSNNLYEILSNTFGENRNKVYCSQLIPQSGLNEICIMQPGSNPYRHSFSYSHKIKTTDFETPVPNPKWPHNVKKKFIICYAQNYIDDLTIAPKSKIYFPLPKWREIVPNYHLRPVASKDKQSYNKQEKYYIVDEEKLKEFTGERAKLEKNNFWQLEYKPMYVPFNENDPITICGKKYANLYDYTKELYNNEKQMLNNQLDNKRKQTLIDKKRKFDISQTERKSGYSLYDQYNQYGNDYPIYY